MEEDGDQDTRSDGGRRVTLFYKSVRWGNANLCEAGYIVPQREIEILPDDPDQLVIFTQG